MPVIIDLYTERRSWVHRMDPRVKLFFVAGALVLLLVFKNLYLMLAALVILHIIHLTARMPSDKIGFIWKTLLPVALLMTTLWVVFYPTGTPFFTIWILEVSALSLAQGLVLGLRILTMAFVVFAWLYTTDQPSLIHSLVKLKVPFEWGLVLALALRYIPTFQSMYGVISDAQQARGLDVSETTGFKRVQRLMPVFVAMVISSLRTSDQLAKALEARGFGAQSIKRTTLHEIRFAPSDYVYTTIIALTVIASLVLYFVYGFGAHALNLFSG